MNPGKKTEKADKAVLYERLASLQRSARKEQIPVLILFEGMERAGKGVCVRELTLPFDPRGFHVAVFGKPDKEERRYPWFRRYMMEIPEKGSIHLFNDSWYTDDTRADKDGKVKPEVRKKWTEICRMERQLVMDGMIVFKFFLRVSREEHKRRLDFPDGKRRTGGRSGRPGTGRGVFALRGRRSLAHPPGPSEIRRKKLKKRLVLKAGLWYCIARRNQTC